MPDSLLRVLTCGSVDDGKSTLIGRLLFECGSIPDDVMAALERDSRRFGTVEGGVDYALLVDGLEAEREQGVTIDVAYRFFETPARRFILADTPGHQQYTRNMVTGASTADLAILLVDARKGILPQTRRHAAIASLLGIRQVVLAVNKMDLVDFDQAVFAASCTDFRTSCAASCAFDPSPRSRSAPAMATTSPNTAPACPGTRRHAAARAGKGRARTRDQISPFRFPVQYVNRPDQSFRGYAGTIASGTIRPATRWSTPPRAPRRRSLASSPWMAICAKPAPATR